MAADRFYLPLQQVLSATPTVREGAKLYFYASGTSTLLDTYTTETLAVANSNPVILNALGQPSGAIFLTNAAYKVVLKDSSDVEIWTQDPVYGPQYSTTAQFRSGAGSPNGSVAGTAGSASIPASVYWDTTNAILYVCTQTGTSSTAVWTAVNAATAANVTPSPQGRLTLTSATPVLISTVSGATVVYYTPYVGNLVPIYSGSSFVPTTISELSLTISGAYSANSNYDVFIYNNSGVVVALTGPAWSSATARGTGAGTTQLSMVSGILVNTVAMTGRNGGTTYSVPANRATYVGTIRTNGSTQVDFIYGASGVAGFLGVWNQYNRVLIASTSKETAGAWTYGGAGGVNARAANGTSLSRCSFVTGAAEDAIVTDYRCMCQTSGASASQNMIGSALDVTNTMHAAAELLAGSAVIYTSNLSAPFSYQPQLGFHFIQGMEVSDGVTTSAFFALGPVQAFPVQGLTISLRM